MYRCSTCWKCYENLGHLEVGKTVCQVEVKFAHFGVLSRTGSLAQELANKGHSLHLAVSVIPLCPDWMSPMWLAPALPPWGASAFPIHLCLRRWWEWQLEVEELSLHNERGPLWIQLSLWIGRGGCETSCSAVYRGGYETSCSAVYKVSWKSSSKIRKGLSPIPFKGSHRRAVVSGVLRCLEAGQCWCGSQEAAGCWSGVYAGCQPHILGWGIFLMKWLFKNLHGLNA